MKDINNYDLTSYNTFGIKAFCRRFVEFDSLEELRLILTTLTAGDAPLLILGGGSNLLLTDDYSGTVLHSAIKGISVDSMQKSVLLRVGSGETWDDVVRLCVDNGWYGAENLSFIPGEVGASAVQNIGAYGVEAKDIIYKVEAVEIGTGQEVSFTNEDCAYSYRQSRFKGEWRDKYVITYVTYRLKRTFCPQIDYGNIRLELEKRGFYKPTAAQLRDVIIGIRKEKLPDPDVEGNAGSFFMNPVVPRAKYDELSSLYPEMPHYRVDAEYEKIPAGWLIESCGWRGKSLGRAGVHSRQALVLVNRGGADGKEIMRLCDMIRNDVRNKFGIEIYPEVNIK
ncbi:MAG: UDP-N-acetylmuramate dehydrogenase [Prevotella sp.]|uniref:UDP-N-acetylmuramate dehydrogenase n=1 Tax=Prevotella sp. PTAC TaxID=2736295 RepID=UPI001552E174|nr:UDP-N-acetylmuramate dehydrogenase [Prevotella sp. PTAC]MCX4293352.1 UDP-N-acetylmuramate dehydrogenase [Prevotella sp.]NPD54413.1 UDP-N-acetylmuramate dehydrogenase [Prevotella sp. PTAC]